jgi:hypothetical protein
VEPAELNASQRKLHVTPMIIHEKNDRMVDTENQTQQESEVKADFAQKE